MVLFFTSKVQSPDVTIYMGKDKVENEDLIKYAHPTQDIWFHVDKLSSAHVYLRIPTSPTNPLEGTWGWESIPEPYLIDCAQLVKANSIEGNKKDNITIIYTPAENLKKTGDMAVGQVSFHNDKKVKRIHIATRTNTIVNRLNKTKVEKDVDHEAERIERVKKESKFRREIAASKKKADTELARQREADKHARSYDRLFEEQPEDDDEYAYEYGGGSGSGQRKTGKELEDDFM